MQITVTNYFINFYLKYRKTYMQGSDLLTVAQGLYTTN